MQAEQTEDKQVKSEKVGVVGLYLKVQIHSRTFDARPLQSSSSIWFFRTPNWAIF